MKSTAFLIGAALVLAPMASAQVAPAPGTPAPAAGTSAAAQAPGGEDDAAYILGPGDIIEATLVSRGGWQARARVQVDGSIQLPLIGQMTASNRTTLQLADEIKNKLKSGGFFSDPVVSVEISSYASRYATVLGDVGSPGLVPIDREYRVSEVLARVGGVKDSGADVLTLRRETGEELQLSIHDLATGGDDKDPRILPGDKVYVPQAATFYIYGQIAAPGIYKLDRDMTLRQAIARSGGLTPSGSEKRIRVYRNGQEIKKFALGDLVTARDTIVVGERFF